MGCVSTVVLEKYTLDCRSEKDFFFFLSQAQSYCAEVKRVSSIKKGLLNENNQNKLLADKNQALKSVITFPVPKREEWFVQVNQEKEKFYTIWHRKVWEFEKAH